jgi:hypothetical protein
METLQAYIPTDRRYALASGSSLSEISQGAALYAQGQATAFDQAMDYALSEG